MIQDAKAGIVEIQARYPEWQGISQSGIKLFLEDPGSYRDERVLRIVPPSRPTASRQWGLDFEQLVMGQLRVVKIPEDVLSASGSRAGGNWQTWRDEQLEQHGPDVRLYTDKEWDEKMGGMLAAQANIQRHAFAAELIGHGYYWPTYEWIDLETGLPCHAHPDGVYGEDEIVWDLKTAGDISADGWARDAFKWGYHVQQWWYCEGVRQNTGHCPAFCFIVVKNSRSWGVEVMELHSEWMEFAGATIRGALQRMRIALETDVWDSPTHGRVVTLPAPSWAKFRNR